MAKPEDCADFNFQNYKKKDYNTMFSGPRRKQVPPGQRLESEHVLEAQMISIFFSALDEAKGKNYPDPYDKSKAPTMMTFCRYIGAYWNTTNNNPLPKLNNVEKSGPKWIADEYPTKNKFVSEFFLLPKNANGLKKLVSCLSFIMS